MTDIKNITAVVKGISINKDSNSIVSDIEFKFDFTTPENIVVISCEFNFDPKIPISTLRYEKLAKEYGLKMLQTAAIYLQNNYIGGP